MHRSSLCFQSSAFNLNLQAITAPRMRVNNFLPPLYLLRRNALEQLPTISALIKQAPETSVNNYRHLISSNGIPCTENVRQQLLTTFSFKLHQRRNAHQQLPSSFIFKLSNSFAPGMCVNNFQHHHNYQNKEYSKRQERASTKSNIIQNIAP